MPQRPLFSVLVPTYNQAPYLGPALDSLLGQTFSDWEAVIINDGSTDSTPQVLADYIDKDERFRVFHKENGGPGSALNVGLQHARGQWICWLSSDDFFDPRKLEIHRDWIAKRPEDRFFFTYFREFNAETSEFSDPPLWHKNPEREWQVVEMLHHTYVHGNSICVSRDLWWQAGRFDTELRFGQDYDMWLRLAALSPATFIPERTCITRVNPLQMTQGFPEARFYDCAKAGIKFLNQHTFVEMFPAVDLTDSRMARRALVQTLDVAQNPYSFIYRLGAHPLLLFRIILWIDSLPAERATPLRKLVLRRAADVSRLYRNSQLGFLWTIAKLAMQLQETDCDSKSVSGVADSAMAVAEAEYWRLRTTNAAEAASLRLYLERFGSKNICGEKPPAPSEPGEVLFICHSETHETSSDTMRQLTQAAKSLMRDGHRVVLIVLGESGIKVVDGVLMLGALDKTSLGRALKSAGALDTVIEAHRAEIVKGLSARRALVYRPQLKSPGNDKDKQPTISAAQGSRESPGVEVVVSDSANWSDIIESFAATRHSGQEASTYLQKRMTQAKRKLRNIASR